jgi:hypothetical protein
MAEYQIKEDAKIMGVRIEITSPDGSKISPSYEAHSIERVNQIVAETQDLIHDGSTIEVFIY